MNHRGAQKKANGVARCLVKARNMCKVVPVLESLPAMPGVVCAAVVDSVVHSGGRTGNQMGRKRDLMSTSSSTSSMKGSRCGPCKTTAMLMQLSPDDSGTKSLESC
ncbi:uncharacterized protein ACNLHF_027012 [Anomaloglossus baeobatrachus]